MVLDKLGNSLKETLKKIARAVLVDEKLIDELIKDIQKALLNADVNVQLVFDLTKEIKNRALKEKPPTGVNQREYIIKIVYEELVKFLGEEKSELIIGSKKPFKIMLLGLYGSGKSTSAGKLSKYYSKRGYKIATMALDVHRAAAIDQLEQVSKQVNVFCFSDRNEKNPVKIYKKFAEEIKKYDLLIIDTAGRDALSSDLIKEIIDLNETIKPDENLLVINADIGQAARKQVEGFHNACKITGVIVTKLDGTARGGGALTATSVTGSKIKFIGTGEKVDDLEIFNPKGFVSRLLGMGDLELLLEKAKGLVNEEDAQELSKKLLKGDFNFIDLYNQMQAMKKMGPLNKIIELIPGFGKMNIPKDMLDVKDEKIKKWKYILDSCTKKELEDPEVIDNNRMERLAKGSGVSTSEVRELLKQYKQSKKLMKLMKGNDPSKLMQKFSKLKGLGKF